jgi:hypothetical protein
MGGARKGQSDFSRAARASQGFARGLSPLKIAPSMREGRGMKYEINSRAVPDKERMSDKA